MLQYSEGTLHAHYIYDAWGNHQIEAFTESGIGDLNPIRYRSYYYDTETGLYYLRARYYDPETGRFISQDNISYLDPDNFTGLNLYAYCNDNPVYYIDANGHESLPWWAKILIGVGFVVVGAVVTALTAGTGVGVMAAFGAALLTSAKAVAVSTAISAGIGLAIGGLTTGSWEGALNGMINSAVDGFMWGGIFAGGAQILSGTFKGYAQVANHFGKLQNIKKSPIFSPDRLKNATEISKIAKKGQSFYDYGGTILRFGKFAHMDVSTKSLLHLAALGFNHIPLGTILASLIGGF